ncbi:MAG: hypothetical protein ACE5NL_00085 [Candidatus Hydrothermarchaeaceae archaeon]
MKLKCIKCGYIWRTYKERIPLACPRCNNKTWFNPPKVLEKGVKKRVQ